MSETGKPSVLVLGASGMLGSTIFRKFDADDGFRTFGTIRSPAGLRHFSTEQCGRVITHAGLESEAGMVRAFSVAKPDIVINCVGIIKQLPSANDHLESLSINSVLPHRIANYCSMVGARLIHFSTDCVFSGAVGQYAEGDHTDAYDLYGRTKYLGEVDYESAITLRTSIIGHELASAHSLIDWFLNQSGEVKGYRRAIFSGLPTIEVASVLRDFVIPNPQLRGLYHLSADPISKFDLLTLVANTYGKKIKIVPDEQVVIDRSLNSDRFRSATGFAPKPWPQLLEEMYRDHQSAFQK